jgi:hypothetical protein
MSKRACSICCKLQTAGFYSNIKKNNSKNEKTSLICKICEAKIPLAIELRNLQEKYDTLNEDITVLSTRFDSLLSFVHNNHKGEATNNTTETTKISNGVESENEWMVVQGSKSGKLVNTSPNRKNAEIVCTNRFQPIEKSEDEPGSPEAMESQEVIVVGDSIIRYLDNSKACCRKKQCSKRMRVCYPGARVEDISDVYDRSIVGSEENAKVVVHVGTNNIRNTRSEELVAKYEKLIKKMVDSKRDCMISGILPTLNGGSEWSSRAL